MTEAETVPDTAPPDLRALIVDRFAGFAVKRARCCGERCNLLADDLAGALLTAAVRVEAMGRDGEWRTWDGDAQADP